MDNGTAIAGGIGAVAILGIGAIILINASNQSNIQTQNQMNPNTGQPVLSGDAGLLYAGLSGGGNFLSGLFTGIGRMNNSNSQVNYGNYSWNPSQPIGPGNSPASFGTPFQGGAPRNNT